MLKKDDRHQQMVYYQVCAPMIQVVFGLMFWCQAGIGTYTIPQIAKPWMAKLSKKIDMMVGMHLDAHVQGTRYPTATPRSEN